MTHISVESFHIAMHSKARRALAHIAIRVTAPAFIVHAVQSSSLLLTAVICSGDTAYLALLSVHSSAASSAVVCALDVDGTARGSHVTIAV
eukprot:1813-Heterococcus_DN1.PRE.1